MAKAVLNSPLSDVYDEGVFSLSTKGFDFVGSGVTVTPVAGKAQVSIPGSVDTNNYVATFIVAPTSGGTGAAGRATHATIAAAVAAITGNTVIYLLEGTHAVAGTITLPTSTGNIALIGGGPASIVRLDNGVNADVLTTSGTGRLVLSDFTIDGNKASNTAGTGFVMVSSLSSVTIRNVIATNCKEHGVRVYFGSPTEDPLLEGVQAITNDGDGFVAATNAGTVTFVGCLSRGNGGDGFDLSAKSSLTGCISRNNGLRGYIANNGSVVTFAGCQALDNSSRGFLLDGASSRHSATGCLARGNVDAGFFIGSAGCVVSGCYSELNTTNGITLSSATAVTITGCTLLANTSHGISVGSSVNTVISGCEISGNGAAFDGINIGTGAAGCAITGNRISGHTYGIAEVGTANSNIFTGNVISGATAASYNILGANSKIQDPGVVTITITRTAAAGSGSQVIDSVSFPTVAQFKPTSVEFIGSDDANQSVYSDGWSDSSINSCHQHNTLTDAADLTKAINIQNMTPDGYTANVSLLGKAGGSAQEGFTLDWTVVGAGRAVTVKALLRR